MEGNQTVRPKHAVITDSDTIYDLCCDICSEEDDYLEAEGYCTDCRDYLCKDCFNGHRRSRQCRNHVLLDKDELPCQKPLPSVAQLNAGTSTEKCARHPDRLVEYYCHNDQSLGCSVCITLKHRMCKDVSHIPDLTEHLLDSREFTQFTNSLQSLKITSQNIVQNTKVNKTKIQKWIDNATKRLQELRRHTNTAFDKCELNLREKTNALKSTDEKKLKDVADKGTAVLIEVEQISAEIQRFCSKNQLDQLFISMKTHGNRLETLKRLLINADADAHVTVHKFVPGDKIQEIIRYPTLIGEIAVRSSLFPPISVTTAVNVTHGRLPSTQPTKPSTTPRYHRNAAAALVREINVQTKGDTEQNCRIVGSAMLPDNKLVLTDYGNSKIKLLNLETFKVTSELKTASYPWDVTNIIAETVAVTLTSNKHIMFLGAKDKLTVHRTIRVNGHCDAILYSNENLIVSFVDPVKIELMDMNGKVKRKIEESNLFKGPSNMCLGPDHDVLYVSDNECHSVTRIGLDTVWSARAVYRDTDLYYNRGLTVDKHGRVLVCGEDSHNIHLLTADLNKVKVLIEGLDSPASVSYCHNTDRLYVGMDSDIVKVYQMY